VAKGPGGRVNGSPGLLPFADPHTRFYCKLPGKPCLELQDALSKQLPPEIHHKLLPASRTIALRRTPKTMRVGGCNPLWTGILIATDFEQTRP
jgi:hypothetical protein